MSDKKPPVIGLVSVRKAWIDATCFGQLFRPVHGRTDTEIYILPVAKYNVTHPAFVEIEWYPRVLDGKPAKLFIPTHEVIGIAIIGSEAEEQLGKVGFQVESLS